jgi:DtxR family Mn-dependent transcriptional regulator
MSEAVERKLLTLLGNPTVSPFGNPIPGLDELSGGRPPMPGGATSVVLDSLSLLAGTATEEGRPVVIRRISEQLQEDPELLRILADLGVRPGAAMLARLTDGSVTLDGQLLPPGVAEHLFVTAEDEDLTPLEVAHRF